VVPSVAMVKVNVIQKQDGRDRTWSTLVDQVLKLG